MSKSREPITLYRVRTLAGTTIALPTDFAYVQKGGNFLRINPQYLKEGDRVQFEKEFAKKSLNEIDLILISSSPEYGSAKRTLYTVNSQNVDITLFRYLLWTGAANNGMISRTKHVRERALLEDMIDFNGTEYRSAANGIHRVVNANDEGYPSWDAVVSWLQGRVIAPQQWEIFHVLGKYINPKFTEIYESKERNGGFWGVYKYYVTRRQGIMAYIAEAAEKIKRGSPQSKGTSRYPIRQELDIILPLIEKKTGKFITEVISVEEIQQRRNAAERRKMEGHPTYRRGLVFQDAEADKKSIKLNAYSVFDITAGINPFDDPVRAAEEAKLFSLRTEFPLQMIKDYFFNESRNRRAQQQAREDAKAFAEKHINPGSLIAEFMGKMPIKPGEEEIARIAAEEATAEVYRGLREWLNEHRDNLRTFDDELSKE